MHRIVFALPFLLLAGCGESAREQSEASPAASVDAVPSAPLPQRLFDGLGGVHLTISTKSELAQKYFDQGLALAWAFNHAAADLAFTEAATHDPECALCYWGSALVLGPNVNAPMEPANAARAFTLASKAVALAAGATPLEQVLANALLERYAEAPPVDRGPLDQAYAGAMRAVALQFPGDANVGTLAAEALMDLHPWDFWHTDGAEQSWTPEVLALLEGTLARAPEHVGAIHLYIHAVEQSSDARRAEPYADRLAALAPTAGHLVHMPAHIYIRIGRYHDAAMVNERAAEADTSFLAACRADGLMYKVGYVPHNWHFGWVAAGLAGSSAQAMALAKGTAARVPDEFLRAPGLEMVQSFHVQPLFAMVQFGRWDDALAAPEPAADLAYSHAIWLYATGRARLGKGDIDGAAARLAEIEAVLVGSALDSIRLWNINDASDIIAVAASVLAGEIAAARGDLATAVEKLDAAADMEDTLGYTEPPDWVFPVRHALGAAQLAAGDAAAAESTYREDLAIFPENGRSLFGLEQSLRAQGKTTEANAVQARFAAAWAHADVVLTGSRI